MPAATILSVETMNMVPHIQCFIFVHTVHVLDERAITTSRLDSLLPAACQFESHEQTTNDANNKNNNNKEKLGNLFAFRRLTMDLGS